MLRRLSQGEIGSLLAVDMPGVNKEAARHLLRYIHAYKFRPTALMFIQVMEDIKFCSSEMCRVLRQGVDLSTIKT
ncbi:hypothetical protein JXB28_00285 [Candidatus Woesearchaeota archaeon]|nr:hypothetical protein [Candidatus Woesearchaeota archaeon]